MKERRKTPRIGSDPLHMAYNLRRIIDTMDSILNEYIQEREDIADGKTNREGKEGKRNKPRKQG